MNSKKSSMQGRKTPLVGIFDDHCRYRTDVTGYQFGV